MYFAGIPYTLFSHDMAWRYLGMAFCLVAGIVCFVIAVFCEKQEYSILKQEPLLFDYEYLKELRNEYRMKKKKYVIVAIPCTVLFIVGLIFFAFTMKGLSFVDRISLLGILRSGSRNARLCIYNQCYGSL